MNSAKMKIIKDSKFRWISDTELVYMHSTRNNLISDLLYFTTTNISNQILL